LALKEAKVGASTTQQVSRPPTLTAATAKHIEEAILRGQFVPGTPLREGELSEVLGVSRGTVREALQLLGREGGPVEIIPHRGAFVAKLSVQRAREIYTLRALLEPFAVRLAMEAEAYNQEDLQELEAHVRRLEQSEREGEDFELIETDYAFHQLLIRRCNHELLREMVSNVQSRTFFFFFNTKLYRSDVVPDSISHRAILDVIRGGDPLAAEEVVKKHINEAGSSLVMRMEEASRGKGDAARQIGSGPISGRV
jgi:DNA-binding GntR family transcriptional regulator